MRAIKFRSWNYELKIMLSDIADGMIIKMNDGKLGWYGDDEDSYEYCDYPLMQFTGLLDKNGKEVYEGDIVIINNHRCEVKYGGMAFYFYGIEPYANGRVKNSYDTVTNTEIEKLEFCEVIGNKYENPELLK